MDVLLREKILKISDKSGAKAAAKNVSMRLYVTQDNLLESN